MSDTFSAVAPEMQTEQLRRRIDWPCRVIRLFAAAYAVWTLYMIVRFWLDAPLVERIYSGMTKTDVSGSADWQRLVGASVHLLIWTAVAAACYSVWRLFGAFSAGRIFNKDTTVWLRRAGVFGLVAHLGDILARPLLSGLMSMHLAPGSRAVAVTLNP
ncbi:MAG: hypothetical protein ACRC56_13100, partial [Bosea sp. (in: a-proteobacteria)]